MKKYIILFVCSSNTIQSVLAEAILNHLAQQRQLPFRAFSASVLDELEPIHPCVLTYLQHQDIAIDDFQSRSWRTLQEITKSPPSSQPSFDFVFTLSDDNVDDIVSHLGCKPTIAHWGMPTIPTASEDDIAVDEVVIMKQIKHTFLLLKRRIELLLALPIHKLPVDRLTQELDSIGKERRLNPRPIQDSTPAYFKKHVFFCLNQREDGSTCCAPQGNASHSQAMFDYCKTQVKALDLAGEGKVRINRAGCLDRCQQGPVMVVYPQGTWYTFVDQHDIDEIIERDLQNNEVVTRLVV
jgi:(2Fe-2S) ferredoxin/protein-tyrosine-phosphatase